MVRRNLPLLSSFLRFDRKCSELDPLLITKVGSTPGLKFWFRCSTKSGYLYQMDIYSGRKQTPEFNLGLGEEVVLQLTKDLEQSFCSVYFDNFFDSPKLTEKVFQKGIYGIGTV